MKKHQVKHLSVRLAEMKRYVISRPWMLNRFKEMNAMHNLKLECNHNYTHLYHTSD